MTFIVSVKPNYINHYRTQREILRKCQSNFLHYHKKIEAQAKNGFLIKKNVYATTL